MQVFAFSYSATRDRTRALSEPGVGTTTVFSQGRHEKEDSYIPPKEIGIRIIPICRPLAPEVCERRPESVFSSSGSALLTCSRLTFLQASYF
jgi:hypothetical protein